MNKKLAILSAAFLMTAAATAQTAVKGHVADKDGEPVVGAAVKVGNKVVAITDNKGDFSITKLPAGTKTVTISYIGMETQSVSVASTMKVVLADSDSALSEAVVMSYGSGQKLGSVTGSVAAVSSDEIKNRPVANVNDALQGKVTGVQVYTSSGEPSSASSITVRGVGTLSGSSQPLYILDGVAVNATTVLSISPNDIASVSVLKDASATSIYGSRAANGVVIYTTKKGRRGEQGHLSVDASYGVSNLASTKMWDNMMSTNELLDFWKEHGLMSDAKIQAFRTNFGQNETDWRKYFYKENRKTYQANLSYSGGTDKTDYYVAFGLHNQEGLAYRSKYDRYSGKVNLNTEINDWLRAGVNVALSLEDRKTNPYDQNSPLTGVGYLWPRFYTPYDKDGNEYFDKHIPGLNTTGLAYRKHIFPMYNNKVQLTGMSYFELTPIKGLKLKTQNSVDAFDQNAGFKRLPSHIDVPGNGTMSEQRYRRYQWQSTNTAEYQWTRGLNSYTALVGQEWIQYNYNSFTASVEGLADDRLMQLQNGTGKKTMSTGDEKYAYNSFFGRFSYDYASRYFADATLRNDETSLLAPGHRKGTFFSLGGRWKMREENFLKGVNWLNKLDLRTSYGTQGRSAIDPYQWMFLAGATRYQEKAGMGISSVGNYNLGWEKQKQFSVGAELTAFDARLTASAEFYVKDNTDLHMNVPYPYTSGVTEILKNTASLRNTGVELMVSYELFDRKSDFSVEPYVNLAYNKQKVTKLFEGAKADGKYWTEENKNLAWIVGQPVQLYTPIWAGVNKKTGAPQWYLPGDDPTKTTKDPSRVTSDYSMALAQATGKNLDPDWTGGFGVRAGWKGFSLVADFSFQLNKYLFNNDAFYTHNIHRFLGYNQSKDLINNIWTVDNRNAAYPSKNYHTMEFDSRLLENASFMRLKNITLSYMLPKSVLGKTRVLSSASVYVTGRNLITVTNYTGQDPEVNANLTLGGNPNTKQVSVGVNLTF